jgi:hypothetical protein
MVTTGMLLEKQPSGEYWGPGRGLPPPWQTSVHQVPFLSQPQCMLLSNLGYPLKTSGHMHLGQQSFSSHGRVVVAWYLAYHCLPETRTCNRLRGTFAFNHSHLLHLAKLARSMNGPGMWHAAQLLYTNICSALYTRRVGICIVHLRSWKWMKSFSFSSFIA